MRVVRLTSTVKVIADELIGARLPRGSLMLRLTEVHRVLRPGGLLLLAFHTGDGLIHVEGFLGCSVSLDFVLFSTQGVAEELVGAGFVSVEVIERDPDPEVEYPSRRAYVFARKAEPGAERTGLAEREGMASTNLP